MEFKTLVKVIIDQKSFGTILVEWIVVAEHNDDGFTKVYPQIKSIIDFPEHNPIIKYRIKPYGFFDCVALYLENTASFDSKSRVLSLTFATKPK